MSFKSFSKLALFLTLFPAIQENAAENMTSHTLGRKNFVYKNYAINNLPESKTR